jgi:hypothetical protein
MCSRNLIFVFAGPLLFTLLFGTGCDSAFEPIKPNDDIVFSLFGTLYLHADPQWVRVMPIGETLVPTDTAQKPEVTLTRIETGETTMLNDSLFILRNNTKVWNYWTDTQLYPEEKYVLRAKAPDGRTSRATVTIPAPLPRPLTDYSVQDEEGLVIVPTDDSLVVAETRFFVEELTPFGPAGTVELYFSHLDQLFLTDDGEYRFRVEGETMIYNELETGFRVLERELIIAAGSPEWPDLSDLTEEEIPIPNTNSNVENGTGVVAGIARQRAPLKRCVNEEEKLVPCEED